MSFMNELNDELLKQVSGGTEDTSEDAKFEILFEMLYNLRNQFTKYEVDISQIIQNAELSRAAGKTYENIRDDTINSLQQLPGVMVYGRVLTDYFPLLQ